MRPLTPNEAEQLRGAFNHICEVAASQYDRFLGTRQLPPKGSPEVWDAARALRTICAIVDAALQRDLVFDLLNPDSFQWPTPWLSVVPAGSEGPVRVAVLFGQRGNGAVAGAQLVPRTATKLKSGLKTPDKRPRPILIDVSPLGNRKSGCNDSFYNPQDFHRGAFDPEGFVRHIEESLQLLEEMTRGFEQPVSLESLRDRYRESGGRGLGRGSSVDGEFYPEEGRTSGGWRPRAGKIAQLGDEQFDTLLGDRTEDEPDDEGPACAEAAGDHDFPDRLLRMLGGRRLVGTDDEDWGEPLPFDALQTRPQGPFVPPFGGQTDPASAAALRRAWDMLLCERRARIDERLRRLPEQADWRNNNGHNRVAPVRDQGICGSCVAFGVVATLESMLLLERGLAIDFSEAELFSRGGRCKGGWRPPKAIRQLMRYGVGHEKSLPYAACDANDDPHPGRDQQAIAASQCLRLTSMDQRRAYLALVGPVVASMQVYGDFKFYGSGVYRYEAGHRRGGHCIQVVGYDDRQECWIAKNSWGTDWGEEGFFRIGYGQCDIDSPSRPFFGISGTRWVAAWPDWLP